MRQTARRMAPPRVERCLAALTALLDASASSTPIEAGPLYDALHDECNAHDGTWRVDARQLAALAAHARGPAPFIIGITCMALAELAAVREDGSRAQAQVRRPQGAHASVHAHVRAGGRRHGMPARPPGARMGKGRSLEPSDRRARCWLQALAAGCRP